VRASAVENAPSATKTENPDLNTKWEEMAAEVEAQATSQASQVDIDQIDIKKSPSEIGLLDALNGYAEPEFNASIPSARPHIDVTPSPDAPIEDDIAFPTSFTREKGADLNAMRLDVARISADIQSGEELYCRAQKRIENLTQFVEHAEVDFSLLNRLEPENRRLKARNRTLEADLDSKLRQTELLRAELDGHKDRLSERSKQLDDLQSKMTLAKNSLREYERT
jgi:hypothetical protein